MHNARGTCSTASHVLQHWEACSAPLPPTPWHPDTPAPTPTQQRPLITPPCQWFCLRPFFPTALPGTLPATVPVLGATTLPGANASLAPTNPYAVPGQPPIGVNPAYDGSISGGSGPIGTSGGAGTGLGELRQAGGREGWEGLGGGGCHPVQSH
jgi:hypothetical protein